MITFKGELSPVIYQMYWEKKLYAKHKRAFENMEKELNDWLKGAFPDFKEGEYKITVIPQVNMSKRVND